MKSSMQHDSCPPLEMLKPTQRISNTGTGYWDLNEASDLDSKSVALFRGDHKSQWAGPGGSGKKTGARLGFSMIGL